jgi:hypothetical protein
LASETQVTTHDAIKWSGWINGFPPRSGEMATLYGGLDRPGPYLVLMKWYPGYMSAPHTYATDRLSLVVLPGNKLPVFAKLKQGKTIRPRRACRRP